jgi:hypothetical protein
MDMHSGGSQKLKWSNIIIEAESQRQACAVFYAKFNRSPYRVICTCCGEDYSISERDSIEEYASPGWLDSEAEYFKQHAKTKDGRDYVMRERERCKSMVANAKIILADEIADEERQGDIPSEGYVWI